MKKIIIAAVSVILAGTIIYFGLPYLIKSGSIGNAPDTVLLVVAPFDFDEQEFLSVSSSLKNADLNIAVASIQGGTAKSKNGQEAKIDLIVGSARPETYSAVVFIGGGGMSQIKDDDSLKLAASRFAKNNKPVAAIGEGILVLAKSGLLAKKTVSPPSELKNELEGVQATLSASLVSADGIIITGAGKDAAEDFVKAIRKAVKGRK
jgi:putative intracellular protease/amidase